MVIEKIQTYSCSKKDGDSLTTLKEIIIYSNVALDNPNIRTYNGSYILIIELSADRNIRIGSLDVIKFTGGFYAYLGSASGGFTSRIRRHLIKYKKPKWHIDYLLNEAEVMQINLYLTEQRLECLLSPALTDELCFIPHFGSSDCHCKSHLYFTDNITHLKQSINNAVKKLVLT